MSNLTKQMILSPQQQSALDRLLPVARIATNGVRDGLPVLPRTHSIIVGPSGSGKSFLARAVGNHLGIPTLVVNVGSWMVLGSKEGSWTTSLIADWLDRLPPGGGVLVIEEIDKLGSGTPQNTWDRGILMELFDLLDGHLPAATPVPVESIPAESFPQGTGKDQREELQRTLMHRVMIIGCGAWQSAWRSNGRSMGFGDNLTGFLPEPPTREQILASIIPELRQRFREQLILLPPMLPEDYANTAREIARQIPAELQEAWKKEVGGMIRRAADGSLGMRAMEELLLNVLLLSGKGKDPQETVEPQGLKPSKLPLLASTLW